MAEELHRGKEELKGIMGAGFAFVEKAKVCKACKHTQ